VAGIDSSPTAYEMASKAIGSEGLVVGDMYKHRLAIGKFDLILSISTIHHGKKAQIKALLDKVHQALLRDGFAYITLPINDSSNEWMTFKDKEEIEAGTYAPNSGPEKGLPHSFYTREEVEQLFSSYKNFSVDTARGRWLITAVK